jgi:hypothetical protein
MLSLRSDSNECCATADWPYFEVSRTTLANALAVATIVLDFYQVHGSVSLLDFSSSEFAQIATQGP